MTCRNDGPRLSYPGVVAIEEEISLAHPNPGFNRWRAEPIQNNLTSQGYKTVFLCQ